MKKKIMDWAWGHCEWLHWLLRDDVSMRFKLANLITGDRLRPMVAFASSAAKQAKIQYNHGENTSGFPETAPKTKARVIQAGWYIDQALSGINDIWTI